MSARVGSGGAFAGLERLVQLMVQLVWLNACWLGLTLLGGVVLGIVPASVAGHVTARRWWTHRVDPQIASTMWQTWRRYFARGAALGVVTHLWGASVLLTWWLSTQQAAVTAAVSQGLATVGGLVLLLICTQLAWVTDRTTLSIPQTLLAALAAAVGRPVLTVALLVTGLGWPTLLVVLGWPGLLPVLGASVPLVIQAWCVRRAFGEPSGTGRAAAPGGPGHRPLRPHTTHPR